jgi:hypothetical protein
MKRAEFLLIEYLVFSIFDFRLSTLDLRLRNKEASCA